MLLDHLAEVHAVDVVGADDDHDVGLHVLDDVDRLVDRVGGAEVPVLAEALLRGDRGDVVAQQRGEAPHLRDVAVQRVGLVLGQHDDVAVIGIHQITQREIDQAEYSAERDGGLRSIAGQRHQARSLTAR